MRLRFTGVPICKGNSIVYKQTMYNVYKFIYMYNKIKNICLKTFYNKRKRKRARVDFFGFFYSFKN